MLQLSGDLAKDSAVKAATIADNASRIDLAVTVRQEPFDPALEFGHYHEIRGWEGPEGRKPTSTYIESSDGGSTFYLGKRTSDVMLRVYDKAAESGDDHYQNCHRYELEIKGDRAHRTLLALVQADASPSWIMSAVRCWASLHGVQPAFDVTSTVKLVSGFRRRSDADTKLDWLATAVKPTIDWLREFGRGSDASRVLGMDVDGAALGHALAANMGIADDGDEADL
jgi:DNA relaxase NicK